MIKSIILFAFFEQNQALSGKEKDPIS